MADRSIQKHVHATWGALDKDYASFQSHHRDLQKFMQPRRGKWMVDERGDKGSKKHDHILNGTGTYALRALQSGMHAGLTSPARPWIKLITRDPSLRDYRPVREWLQQCTQIIQIIFQRSNIYDTLPKVYGEMGMVGQGPFSVLPHDDKIITTKQFTVGSYRIAQNGDGEVDTFYRKYMMNVGTMVKTFGIAKKSLNGEGVSSKISDMYDKGDKFEQIEVIHAVEPNDDDDFDGKKRKFPVRSIYMESGAEDTVLRHSGFDQMPIQAPRWENDDDSAYATNCPGMDTLGDIKQLQQMENMKSEGVSKQVSPPVKAPWSMKNSQVALLGGHVTFFESDPNDKFEPIYSVSPELNHLVLDLNRIEDRVRTGLYADMFLMLYSLANNPAMTATEIEERHSEKLLLLGPVLERVNNQGLDPTIDIVFQLGLRLGLFPPPPPEAFGTEIGVEYVSVLAQAQRAIGVGNVERFFGFIGGLAQLKPEVRHYVDLGSTVNRYSEMIGAPADLLVDDEQAEEAIEEERRAAALAATTEQAAKGAGAARDLSQAEPSGGGNMLDRVLEGVGAP